MQKVWAKHLPPETEDVNQENLLEFYRTMFERQEIWYRRHMLKLPAPWTEDSILRDYKFTNVYRELDRTSQGLIKLVLLDHKLDLPNLIFKTMVYRLFNTVDTFTGPNAVELPDYSSFNSRTLWKQTVNFRQQVGNPWSTAYMKHPRTRKPEGWNKPGLFRDDIYCNHIIKDVYKKIPLICDCINKKRKADFICRIIETIPGVARFLSHEFFLDFTYINTYWVEPIFTPTRNDYTNVGPGCATGLRLLFPSLKKREQEEGIYWLRDLAQEQLKVWGDFKWLHWDRQSKSYFIDTHKPNLDLHLMEMWTCEFQKYKKMQWGLGKQRTRFTPHQSVNKIPSFV